MDQTKWSGLGEQTRGFEKWARLLTSSSGKVKMTEEDIEKEANSEEEKNYKELIRDAIREANTCPKTPLAEKENLDIIKHLIKRLAVHQIILQKRTEDTNRRLFILSIIMAVGALFSVLTFFCK